MLEIFNKGWDSETIPKDWELSTLIPIFKNKGNTAECGNYRGIKLLEHGMKMYERILDKRLRKQLAIDEMQFGFMPGKGITDPMFIARQVQEKTLEGNESLYLAFVDLKKPTTECQGTW